VPSTFTAETAFFIAAEWTWRIEFVVSVGPHYAGAKLMYDFENLAPFVGPNTGAQSVITIAISSAPSCTALRTSCSFNFAGINPAGKPVATDATLTVERSRNFFAS
jgi:hypothetical protein